MQLSFYSRLESISDELNYLAVSVPLKITKTIGVRGPVPVKAKISAKGHISSEFLVSLYPIGGGRHYIRIKAQVRAEAKVKEGDRVKIDITTRNHADEVSIPKDLASALKAEGVLEAFKSFPNGKKSFTLRKIEEAAKPETREKRIQAAVEEAHKKKR